MTTSQAVDLDRIVDLEAVTTLQPGDVVLFQFDQRLTDDLAADIRDQISAAIGPDVRFLVLGAGIEPKLLRQGDDADGPSAAL